MEIIIILCEIKVIKKTFVLTIGVNLKYLAHTRSLTHSFTHSLTSSLIHSLIHLLTNSLTYSLTHSLTLYAPTPMRAQSKPPTYIKARMHVRYA